MTPIKMGSSLSLNQTPMGSVPNVGGALLDWFQPMVFTLITKTVEAFQNIESQTPISFRGVIQPLQERALAILPEGQRSWTWLMLHSDPTLKLQTDDVVLYNGVRTRVMGLKDYTIYGYLEYKLVQDWEGGP